MPRKQRANYFNFSGGLDTDASILNRNPITMTDISNCRINTDGSVQSRYGIEANELYSDYIQTFDSNGNVPPAKLYRWEFVDDIGNNVVYTVAKIGSVTAFYLGEEPIVGAREFVYQADTGNTEHINVVFDGSSCYVSVVYESGGVYYPRIYRFEYTDSGGIALATAGNLTYRKEEELIPIYDYDKRMVCSSDNYNIHPLEESNTVWADESPATTTTLPEYEFNVSYQSGEKVQVTGGVYRIPTTLIPSNVNLTVGTHLKLINGFRNDIAYDTIRTIYEDGSDTIFILEGLSKVDNPTAYISVVDSVQNSTSMYPKYMCTALGRMFTTTNLEPTRVYFSQIYTEDADNAIKFYTEANPFSPTDSSVVASDGGYFEVSGIDYITGIWESSGAIIIFGHNGVWEATGSGGIFRADDFTVRRISKKGCVSPRSIEEMEGGLVYASEDGINVITKDVSTGLTSQVTSLTDEKLQNLFKELPKANKIILSCTYNDLDKELYVLYNVDEVIPDMIKDGTPTHYRDILIYKLKLQAWYKWTIGSDTDGDKLSITDIWMSEYNDSGRTSLVDDAGASVISDSGDTVATASYIDSTAAKQPMVYLHKYNTVGETIQTSYGRLQVVSPYDFEGLDDQQYIDPYFKSAHQTYSDIMRGKLANYVKVFYQDVPNLGTDEHGIDIFKGGCNLRVALDTASSPVNITDSFGEVRATNEKYGISYNVYPERVQGFTHGTYKHKVLGRGTVLQYIFEGVTDERFFKALQGNTGESPILDDGTNWEEIPEDELVSELEWLVGTTYSVNDTVKVTHPSNFHIVGWSSELIPTESLTT